MMLCASLQSTAFITPHMSAMPICRQHWQNWSTAVNSFPHTTHVSHANMQATLPELVDCSNQLSLRHTKHANTQATLAELVDCSNQLSLCHTYKNMPICRQHCQNKWTAATSFPYAAHTEHANMQATLAEVADCCFTMAVIVTKTSACLSHIAESVSMSMT